MAIFRYKVIKDGERLEDVREAADKFALSQALEREGYAVIWVEDEANRKKEKIDVLAFLKRISTHDRISFARNLGAMINAGLPLTRALSVLNRQSVNQKLKEVLLGITTSISQGKTLSESLKLYPKVFSNLFVSMVKAGEESGNLSGSLRLVSDQLEKNYLLIKKVRGALMYPAVIFCIMMMIGILMMVYVVPTLTTTFQELKVQLPLPTRMIIFLSEFLRNDALMVIAGAVIVGAFFYYTFRSKTGKRFLDTLFLKFPIIGPMTREVNSARTSRTLSSLLSSGVDVVISLNVTRDVVQNSYYKEVLDKAAESIQKGRSISQVFVENSNLYPVFVGEMMSVGEETGKIGEMLTGIAEFYEEEVDQKTKNLSTIIEPLLMVVIGAAVGFFAIAMLMPTYSLVDAI